MTDHIEAFKQRAKAEAAKLGLGLRDYARIKSLQRLELASKLGSEYAGIAHGATLRAIEEENA